MTMKTIPLKPERQAELEDYARRRGKSPADALDEALAAYLEWEQQDFEQAVEGIQQGHEDVTAGRTRPVDQFLNDMREKIVHNKRRSRVCITYPPWQTEATPAQKIMEDQK